MKEAAADSRQVAAAWAVFGKLPGDMRDYRVLSASYNQLDYFDEQIRPYVPEAPTARAEAPPRPYYVFWPGPDTVAGKPTLNCGRADESNVRDASGRLSDRLRFFNAEVRHLVGGGPAAQTAAGYRDLAAAMDAAGRSMPADPEEWAYLDLAGAALEAALDGVRVREVDWLAAGAAALLAGRVVITGAGQVPVEQKLLCLDAICGLLPYGVRATLSAATYARGTGLHGIRLFFGDPPPPGAFELPWAAPPPALAAGAAVRYRQQLTRGSGRGEGAAERIRELFAALMDEADPCAVDDAESVIRRAGRALPSLAGLEDDLAEGAGAVHRARAFVRRGPVPARGAEGARARLWDRIVPGWPDGVALAPVDLRHLELPVTEENLERLTAGLYAVLGSSDGPETVLHYARQARAARLVDRLLAGLLRRLTPRCEASMDGFAEVLGGLGDLTADEPRELRAELADPSPVPLALLRQQSAASLRVLLGAAVPRGRIAPDWLKAPYALVLGGPGPGGNLLADMEREHPGYLDVVRTIARRLGKAAEPWLQPELARAARRRRVEDTHDELDALFCGLEDAAEAQVADAAREALRYECHPGPLVDRLAAWHGSGDAERLRELLEGIADGDPWLLRTLMKRVVTGDGMRSAFPCDVVAGFRDHAERRSSEEAGLHAEIARAHAGLQQVGWFKAVLNRLHLGRGAAR
ncbi:hypothetical protein [Streptomyces sp. NBC_01481]|uniref:hypothetical protein n=1 Tax=Streptomyces sp. NBC_01481 TaxID=2975869 RepID=UPI002252C5DC|nr:hypothetical protein [Streptomyces sp. NBC_01481]MCX4585545.1 hypothetical protein [Streptomyces sp. NBC_01481]